MKRLSIVCLAFVLAITFGFANAYAASAKATCQAGDLSEVQFHSYGTIFEQIIHTASQKDLFVDVSLECGLTTNTKVMSKVLEKALATAEAAVMVRVLVDPVFDSEGNVLNIEDALATPGEVTFARRHQTLIAEFAGDISGALSIVDGALVIDETLIAPETLQLILDTMTANSFNFMFADLAAGDHTVVVQANPIYIDTVDGQEINLEDYEGSAGISKAYVGKGSVTVESVRMVKDEVVELQ